jgi:GxxExxY protein
METNVLTGEIISAAISVHSELGPGLLESAYRACLRHELTLRGLAWEGEVPLSVSYKGLTVKVGYRLDLLVEGIVVVELKAASRVTEVHEAQLLSYLRLSRQPVGLLINFHVKHLRNGVKRMVNGFRG